MNKNYKLYSDSELSEDQVEADVSSYLGYITPFWSKRFRIKSVDEQLTGADKLFDRFLPLYFQFKVSEGLKPLPNSFSLSRPNLPLQKIRTFRLNNNINADPTLYFKLRKKAKTATNFQHNILKSLHNPPKQFAFYVAPLTLKIEEYNKLLEISMMERLFGFEPFYFRDETLFSSTSKKQIGLMPFLRGHISINPHEDVSTSDHYYSYSKAGTNIAWHSGEKLNGDYRLSSQIQKIYEYAYNSKDILFSKQSYVDDISNIFKDEDFSFNEIDDLDFQIQKFSSYLKSKYNIKIIFLEVHS